MSDPAPCVSVQELDAHVEKLFRLKAEIKKDAEALSEKNKELASLESTAANYLKALGRKNYRTPFGTIYVKQTWRVNLPAYRPDWDAFFGWLKEKNIYDEYVTVNAQRFNSLYMAEWKTAKREGRGMDFSLPGVGEPKMHESLGVNKTGATETIE